MHSIPPAADPLAHQLNLDLTQKEAKRQRIDLLANRCANLESTQIEATETVVRQPVCPTSEPIKEEVEDRLKTQLTEQALQLNAQGRIKLSAQKVQDLYDEHWLPKRITHTHTETLYAPTIGKRTHWQRKENGCRYYTIEWHPTLIIDTHLDKLLELQMDTVAKKEPYITLDLRGHQITVLLVHWEPTPQ